MTNVYTLQCIITKYISPSNVKGARVKATTSSGKSLTRGYDYEGTQAEVHAAVAMELARSLGWTGTWIQGGYQNGYIFVPAKSRAVRA